MALLGPIPVSSVRCVTLPHHLNNREGVTNVATGVVELPGLREHKAAENGDLPSVNFAELAQVAVND